MEARLLSVCLFYILLQNGKLVFKNYLIELISFNVCAFSLLP